MFAAVGECDQQSVNWNNYSILRSSERTSTRPNSFVINEHADGTAIARGFVGMFTRSNRTATVLVLISTEVKASYASVYTLVLAEPLSGEIACLLAAITCSYPVPSV